MEALIITNSDKSFSQLAEVVRSSGDYNIVRAASGAVSRRIFTERDFDLVIIGTVADDKSKNIAKAFSETLGGGLILLEDSFICEAVTAELEDYGVIVIPRPVHRSLLVAAIKLVYATNMRINNIRRQNVSLVREIEDLRFINKAKYVLMESLGYSENQAHKYIEKRSMDERKSKKAIALEVLKTYGV